MTAHTFSSSAEGVRRANDTTYGLSASSWSNDKNNCLRANREINTGRIWINTVMGDGLAPPLGRLQGVRPGP